MGAHLKISNGLLAPRLYFMTTHGEKHKKYMLDMLEGIFQLNDLISFLRPISNSEVKSSTIYLVEKNKEESWLLKGGYIL